MLQKEYNDWVKKCMQLNFMVPGQDVDQRKLGREITQKDCQAYKLNKEDAMDRVGWSKQTRDDG